MKSDFFVNFSLVSILNTWFLEKHRAPVELGVQSHFLAYPNLCLATKRHNSFKLNSQSRNIIVIILMYEMPFGTKLNFNLHKIISNPQEFYIIF